MQIKDLIAKLEALYNTYDDEYKSVMGEPEIMIDVFQKVPGLDLSQYAGYSPKIVIEKSSDGVNDILSCFHEDYYQNQKAEESASYSMPWPQIWQA